VLARSWLAACSLVATLLGVAAAEAQSGYFYLDRAQLSGAPDDGFMVFRPYVSKANRFYGTAGLGYSHNPLRSESVTDNAVLQDEIDNPMQGQLIFYPTFGVQLASRVGASLTLPISFVNITGNDPQRYGVGTGGMDDATSAVHDLRIDVRVRSFELDDGNARFGGGLALFAPTGNSTAFAGDGQTTGWLFGSAEFNIDKFLFAGHIGPHFRPERSIGGANGSLALGTELRWAFGLYLPLSEGRLRVGGELFGTTGLLSEAGPKGENTIFGGRNTALEWLAQARFLIAQDPKVYINGGVGTRLSTGYGAPDFRMLFSIGKFWELADLKPDGPPPRRNRIIVSTPEDYDLDTDKDGYPDAVDKCPSEKEDKKPPEPTDGCPGNSDRDSDGIPDATDACPDQAEDKDRVQDDDGCPEEDADSDGIPDVSDKCPLEPGVRGDNPEKTGCPTRTRVTESGEVQLLQPIEFEIGRAVIKAGSFPILDEVVALMRSRPNLRIGVYGHTDNRGPLALNTRLSRERAAACKNYLQGKGIDGARLESNGFGPAQPIADNASDDGRARNRRVEFKILSGQ